MCVLATSALTAPALAGTIAEDAKAFGTRQFVEDVSISPSGKKIVMLVAADGAVTTASIIDIASAQVTRVAQSDGKPEQLTHCEFASDAYLICRYRAVDKFPDGTLANFSRLLVVNADGSGMRPMGQSQSGRAAYINQYDGSVIDYLPGKPGQVLVQRNYVPEVGGTGHLINRTKEGLGVDMVDLSSLKGKTVEAPRSGVDYYMTDTRGNVRFQAWSEYDRNSGQLTGDTRYKYRVPGSDSWQDLATGNDVTGSGIRPLAIDGERNLLYALRRMNGRDALVSVALDATRKETLVAQNPNVDIDGIVRFGRDQRVIGYSFAEERRDVVYFDPEFDKLHAQLAKAVPGKPGVSFVDASTDGNRLLIMASSDVKPGTFYTYDRDKRTLAEVAPIRPDLDGRVLAKMTPISIKAPDGANIPAYLTLPPGKDGKNLPTVVLPHGGPSSRDEWGFDWLPQFLAARGYAVIQPQYRGSAGYGDAWLNKNGWQGWRTSIGDITASAKQLVAQGIADPNRIAIFGWSYGGYAALQSAATEPGLYKSVIAVAPVTDLAMLLKDSENYNVRDIVRREIGTGPHIVQGSPLQQASSIKVPVLLVHGDMDVNVNVRHSDAMLQALRSSGVKVDMLRYTGLDHQLDDSKARIEMLTRAGTLLDQTIGH